MFKKRFTTDHVWPLAFVTEPFAVDLYSRSSVYLLPFYPRICHYVGSY